jgi:hypothetical protein
VTDFQACKWKRIQTMLSFKTWNFDIVSPALETLGRDFLSSIDAARMIYFVLLVLEVSSDFAG